MLIKRISKTVFENKNGGFNMNFPKDAIEKFGKNYVFDLHDDRIVMFPIESLGKIEETK